MRASTAGEVTWEAAMMPVKEQQAAITANAGCWLTYYLNDGKQNNRFQCRTWEDEAE